MSDDEHDDPCCPGFRDTALIHSRDCPVMTAHLRKLHDNLEHHARYEFLRDEHGRPL